MLLIFLCMYLGVKLLSYMVSLCLTFEELPNWFPVHLHPSTLLAIVYENLFLHILANVFLCLL